MDKNEVNYFFDTYNRFPIHIKRGKGVYLFDENDNKYLDFFGGLAVNSLGYNDPDVRQAIINQIEKYIHLSNYFIQEPQQKFAKLLATHTGYKKIFFTNSGTEAIEGAIKISRKWGTISGKSEIISFSNSFHGRTLGALSLMDRIKYRDGFGPFLPGCTIIPFNDPVEIEKNINERTAAVFLEFLQGESGIISASEKFIEVLNRLQKKYKFLIVADEIQSGMGRTGKFFFFEHFNITPDIVVIAKAVGGGLPLGAILGNDSVANIFSPGTHGSTFGGNPVACAAGIAVLNKIIDKRIVQNAERIGKYLFHHLHELQKEYPAIIKNLRGAGCMIGIELDRDCTSIVTEMREQGILINCTNSNVIRLLPPLIIEEKHADYFIKEFRSILSPLK
ncbi:MAG: aspartate aminotransferase family protein [Ignavibacteriales bacterium]|nr:aspartate aminotransferase family protein [Ignavibacteriales bacterium]